MPILTFEQIHAGVAEHYARTEPSIILTPKGEAVAALNRLLTVLTPLAGQEREETLNLVARRLLPVLERDDATVTA